jgi:hypothetical protein
MMRCLIGFSHPSGCRSEESVRINSTGFTSVILLMLVIFVESADAQQVADPDFDAKVSSPTFTEDHPKVLFDEAHFNRHKTAGSYKPFVDLITNDGFEVAPNKKHFTKETLTDFSILVISNALGSPRPRNPGVGNSAFTDAECDAVRDWVREGGCLLLIADHPPYGAPAAILGKRFGVEMSTGWTTDPLHFEKFGHPGRIVYNRDNKLLGDHSITKGRNDGEIVRRVTSFMGQSLKGPEGSIPFLKLADTAVDRLVEGKRISAAGRAQGIALKFGKGRVVVLGEAGMLTAQKVKRPGQKPRRFGMSFPGIDNRQLALNIMHWLAGIID